MERRASAVWKGDLKGSGSISTESGALVNAPYSFGPVLRGGSEQIPRSLSAPLMQDVSPWPCPSSWSMLV